MCLVQRARRNRSALVPAPLRLPGKQGHVSPCGGKHGARALLGIRRTSTSTFRARRSVGVVFTPAPTAAALDFITSSKPFAVSL